MFRIINKNQLKDVNNIKDLPIDSEYYNTLGGKAYMFYRSDHILIFMSKIQAEYLYTLKEHIFIDSTFYSAPKCSYQVITIRAHNVFEDCYHTLCYGILVDKTESSYIEFLDNIKSYVFEIPENKKSKIKWEPGTIHCDFEQSLILAIKQVFINIQIKLCL